MLYWFTDDQIDKNPKTFAKKTPKTKGEELHAWAVLVHLNAVPLPPIALQRDHQ
jgi:hypothetical protein